MPRKKRRPSRRPETLVRLIELTGVSAGLSFSPSCEGGDPPHIDSYGRVELTGTMDEPVRGIRDVHIVVYSTDDPRSGAGPPPCVGYIHGIKPVLQPALFVSHQDFDRLWTLALSGLLKHAHMVMTPPRYHSASVLSLSFSTHPEE